MNVYLVIGSSGRYDSHIRWYVEAHLNKPDAENATKLYQNWCTDNGISDDWGKREELDENIKTLDPFLQEMWNGLGVKYIVETVKVVEN